MEGWNIPLNVSIILGALPERYITIMHLLATEFCAVPLFLSFLYFLKLKLLFEFEIHSSWEAYSISSSCDIKKAN